MIKVNLMENKTSQGQSQEPKNKRNYNKWLVGTLVIFFVIIIIVAFRNNNKLEKNDDGAFFEDYGTKNNVSQQFPVTSESEIVELKSRVDKNLTYDLVNGNPEKYKGEIIQWGAKVFTEPEKDEDGVYFQAYVGGDDRNVAVLYRKSDFQIKEDDYVIIYGVVKGNFDGENAFGAKLEIPMIEAGYIEAGSRNDVVAPASEIIPVNDSVTQNQFTVTLEKVELADDETRFFIKLKNDSQSEVSFYTYDSKLTQGSNQYESESIYDSGMKLPSSILSGSI